MCMQVYKFMMCCCFFGATELLTKFPRMQHTHAQQGDSAAPFRPETSMSQSMMDIGTRRIFSEEHDLFRQNVRRFFREEVVPYHTEWVGRIYHLSGCHWSGHTGLFFSVFVFVGGRRLARWVVRCGRRRALTGCWVFTLLLNRAELGETCSLPPSCGRSSEYSSPFVFTCLSHLSVSHCLFDLSVSVAHLFQLSVSQLSVSHLSVLPVCLSVTCLTSLLLYISMSVSHLFVSSIPQPFCLTLI